MPRLLARLHYAWTLTWCAVVCAVLFVPVLAALAVRPTADQFGRTMRVWARAVLFGIGIRVERSGTAPTGPAVLVANHQTMLDVPVLFLGVGRPFLFVARSAIRRIPLVGRIMAAAGCVFIDLDDPQGGLRETADRLAAGDAVLMFPEGTRSYGDGLARFRTGAFRLAAATGAPVVPVVLDGAHRLLNERDGVGRPGTVAVSVLPAFAAVPDEPPRCTADRAHAAVAAALGEPAPSDALAVAG